jgi:hypothetical protein
VNRLGLLALVAAVAATAAGCLGSDSASVVDVKQGMTMQGVRALAGEPDRVGPRCWIYQPSSLDADDGRRLCFQRGRVSLVQFIVHGAAFGQQKIEAATADGWKTVLDDYAADGRMDRPHSCGALLAAIAHVPSSPFFSTAAADLRGVEARACHP